MARTSRTDSEGILDAGNAGEVEDWESESAQGGLPKSVRPTVSAMANTNGCTIVLDIKEQSEAGPSKWAVTGVADAAKLRREFEISLTTRRN